MLRALALTLHHGISGQMGETHRRVGAIDMLPARTTGTIGIHAHVGRVNFNFDIVVDLSRDEDRGKGCMATIS